MGGRLDKEKEIVRMIQKMSGVRSPYDIFYDWVECSAYSIANACSLLDDSIWKAREGAYIAIVNQYGEDEIMNFADMFSMLVLLMDDGLDDYLGRIYMQLGMGSKILGQFFTPFNVSRMCASLAIPDELAKSDKIIYINEPSCGSGGMIIAAAAHLNDMGINYQRRLKVVAQDLDWKAVCMCYVQLSLIGVKAVVVQGDTLREPDWETRPKERVFKTPAELGALI